VKQKVTLILPLGLKILVCILMLAFVLMPFPASGLTIRLYFGEFAGNRLVVYYTTDENPDIVAEQALTATVDSENNLAVIRLSPELADHIIQIRLDFPEIEQVVSVRNVSVSSAGIVRHQYNPCDFFSDDNIAVMNDIPQINLLDWEDTAYLKTEGSDPYLLFEDKLVRDMLQYRSSFRRTRLAVCLFVVLGYVMYHVRLFDAGEDTES